MQFKSFMEALKGKQHKIDKNKNGEIDAHDFKLLRKEEQEITEATVKTQKYSWGTMKTVHHGADFSIPLHPEHHKEIAKLKDEQEHNFKTEDGKSWTARRKGDEVHFQGANGGSSTKVKQADLKESEVRMARADYKVGPSGRKSHKEIVFNDAESKDDEEDKKEMKEGVQKVDIPAYLRKQQGQPPLKMSDLKRKDTISDKENLAKLRNEEAEELDEKSDQAKRNKMMKNMMDASRGARHKLNNPVPDAEPEHKTARAQNVAIGRALRSEEKKDDVPFDGPYTKTKPAKNSDGSTQQPMSRARQLAKDAMKKQMKEDIDRLFEKDDTEYDYEGEMAVTQLKTIIRHAEALQAKMQPNTNLPEWVQSKITLATDYIQTASDYLHSELEEGYYEKPASAYRRKGDEVGGGSNAPVAPVPDRKYIKGTPEHKAYKATKKPINGMPTNVKESFDADGNIVNSKVSYKEFAMMLEYETKDGRYVHKGSYGGTYVDPEGADDADDKKPKQQPADKRGRGRPAGAKSGARKITGTSKLFK